MENELLIKLISSKSFPWEKALMLIRDTNNAYALLGLANREDWLALSLDEVLELAEETGNHSSIMGAIIHRGDCSIDKAREIMKDSQYNFQVVNSFVAKDDCPLDEALALIERNGDYTDYIVQIIIARKDCPIEKAIELMEKSQYDTNIVKAVMSRPDWE